MKSFYKILALAVMLAPSPLFACVTCYGKSDSPLASGMNWGIFTLLGFIITVLATIATFFVYIIRKEAAQSDAPAPQQPAEVEA